MRVVCKPMLNDGKADESWYRNADEPSRDEPETNRARRGFFILCPKIRPKYHPNAQTDYAKYWNQSAVRGCHTEQHPNTVDYDQGRHKQDSTARLLWLGIVFWHLYSPVSPCFAGYFRYVLFESIYPVNLHRKRSSLAAVLGLFRRLQDSTRRAGVCGKPRFGSLLHRRYNRDRSMSRCAPSPGLVPLD